MTSNRYDFNTRSVTTTVRGRSDYGKTDVLHQIPPPSSVVIAVVTDCAKYH